VREALSSAFQNIYAEGYPEEATRWIPNRKFLDYPARLAEYRRNGDPRYYKGVEYADVVESLARRRTAEAFAANGYSCRPDLCECTGPIRLGLPTMPSTRPCSISAIPSWGLTSCTAVTSRTVLPSIVPANGSRPCIMPLTSTSDWTTRPSAKMALETKTKTHYCRILLLFVGSRLEEIP